MRTLLPLLAGFAAFAAASPTDLEGWKRQATSGPGVGSCQGDSCKLADISRSSGKAPPTTGPIGVALDNQCVLDSLSKVQSEGRLYKAACPKQVLGPCGSSTSSSSGGLFGGLFGRSAGDAPLEERQGSCTPYTLLFAKGTFEDGDLGVFVGPNLSSALTSSASGWTVTGINYDNTAAGYNCLGMPGGIIAYGIIESTIARCPSTKIIVAGYSQGAEVAHNAVAWMRPKARSHVYGVVTFGDPMNGAPIVGLSRGQIRTECDPLDNICQGGSFVGLQHLSYGQGPWIPDAVAWMKKRVGQIK